MEYKELAKQIENHVKKAAKDNTAAGVDAYLHIDKVHKFALLLAEQYPCDKQVVELSALLHDIHWIETSDYEDHEIKGLKRVEELLKGKIDNKKLDLILKCVKHHRGAKDYKRETNEEQIIACADAMAHISSALKWIYDAGRDKRNLVEVIKWMKEKYKRGWNKLTLPKAREMIKEEYDAINIILDKYEN